MKPHGFTHRESGDNLLLGVALLVAWRRQDQQAFYGLLHTEPDDLCAAVIDACRAGNHIADTLAWTPQQVDDALDAARSYGQMRRDDLGGDPNINESNRKG